MKVGSLVVFIGGDEPPPERLKDLVKWLPKHDEQTIYTVRSIFQDGYNDTCITVEEGTIGIYPTGEEIGVRIEYAREIQPPMDVSELVEQCMCQEAIL